MSLASLKGNASGTGTVTLESPNTNTDRTITLPDSSGTMAINGPAFSAYRASSQQVIATSTYTKVGFNAETFDTNSCYDSTTNYRFTPNLAGYYQLNSGIQMDGFSGYINILIYKNGSQYSMINIGANAATYPSFEISDIVYANGTTDYFEVYVYQNSGVNKNIYSGSSPAYCWFSGSMVRGA